MKCIIDNCEEKCINGHTLTKGIITKDLKEIINKDYKVYTYNSKENKFETIGWKKASTFKFTCKKHDNELFKPIENNTKIDINNDEHLFLHTFRSFSYVYTYKINELDLNHVTILDDVSKFSFNQQRQLTYNDNIITKHDVWFQNFIHNKTALLDDLNKKEHKNHNYITFTINKNIGISGCGVLNLPFVSNNIVYKNNTPLIRNPMSILTLLSKGDKTYVLLSFTNDDFNSEMSLRQLLTIDFKYQNKFKIPGRNIYPIHINIDNFQDQYLNNILNIISKLISDSCRDNIYIKPSIYLKNNQVLNNLFNNKNCDMCDYLNNNINLFTLK